MIAARLLAIAGLLSAGWTPPAAPCHVTGLLPDPACTPGAVATTDLDTVCRTSTRGRRDVSKETKRRVFVAYEAGRQWYPETEADQVLLSAPQQ